MRSRAVAWTSRLRHKRVVQVDELYLRTFVRKGGDGLHKRG